MGISAATATVAAQAVVVTGAIVSTASAVTGFVENFNFKKQSRKDDKTRSTDKPSWVNKGQVDFNQTARENVVRIMNEKYGVGKWTSATSDGAYSKIYKWLTRALGLK